jgi:hypothetical protein
MVSRSGLVLGLCAALTAVASPAHAEWFENVGGGEALVVLPRLKAQSATSFASTGFGGRVFYGFGVLHDLYAVARFSVWSHDGSLQGVTRTGDRGTFTGTLAFHGEGYKGDLGLKYKIVSGFNLTPYVDAFAGYQWTTFRGQDLRNVGGGSFGLSLSDTGRGALTAGAGLSLEYRLFNLVLISASGLYSRVWDADYRGDLSLGVQAALSWF